MEGQGEWSQGALGSERVRQAGLESISCKDLPATHKDKNGGHQRHGGQWRKLRQVSKESLGFL